MAAVRRVTQGHRPWCHNFATGLPIYVMFDNINRKSLVTCGMSIGSIDELDFFAMGLHTRTAIARLPLRQLGFLVNSCFNMQL